MTISRSRRRQLETTLAWLAVGQLVIYLPLEVWSSIPGGLLSPYFIVDVIAMALMTWGVWVSLRRRPRPAPALLCVGYAWCTANGWRATFDRVSILDNGGELANGSLELWAVGGATLLSLGMLIALLGLTAANTNADTDAGHPGAGR